MSRRLLVPAVLAAAIAACNSGSAPAPAASAEVAPTAAATAAPTEATAAAAPPEAASITAEPAAPAASTGASKAKAAPSPKPKTPAPDKTAQPATPPGTSSAAVEPPPPPVNLPPPAAGTADEVAAQIDAVFDPLKTFKAKFKQEHTQKIAGVTKKSSGTILVEKPSKVSFRYDAPNKNRIVSDGSLLEIYIADDQQMFTQPVAKTEYPGALAFIMGHGMRPSFTFTFNDKAKWDGGPVLSGKPRQPTPYYESVQFYVDKALLEKKDPGCIRRVLVVDGQGNRNRFDFEESSAPPSIEAGEFKFDPPPGTNITAQ